MIGSVFRFELRYHLSRPVTLLYFAVFLGLAFLTTGTDMVTVAGAGPLVKRNAPLVLALLMQVMVLVGAVILTAVVGTTVLRDYQVGAHELLFTTSLTKRAYLGGRFAGAVVVVTLVHLAIPIGLWLGSVMPWVDRDQLLPFRLAAYAGPFLTLTFPSVLLVSAIFFAVGALTRSLFWVYTQGIFLLVGYNIAGQLTADLDNRTLAALLDPIGLEAMQQLTRYWTTVERNLLSVPLGGVILANRALWLLVAVALFAVTYAAFRFRSAPPSLRRARRAKRAAISAQATPPAAPEALVLGHGPAAAWRQFLSVTRLSFATVARNIVFLAIVTIGVVNLVMGGWYADSLYGQTVWPVTHTMVEMLDGTFLIFFLILVTVFSGEAIWRERQLGLDQVVDATPASATVSILGKFAGLTLVWLLLLGVVALTGMAVQTAKGYYHYEPGLYATYLLGTTLPSILQTTALAFFVHALVNHKFVGHVVMIVAIVAGLFLGQLGLEHQLWQFAQAPSFTYSDMNGFGPFVPNLLWSAAYWSGVAVLLGLGAFLFWVRGTDAGREARWQAARRRFTGRPRLVAAAGLALAVSTGGVIAYNTSRLNHYQSSKAARRLRADYERTYKSLQEVRQPRLVDAAVRADLEPERRAFTVSGTYVFVNRHPEPLDTLIVTTGQTRLRIDTLQFSRPATALVTDSALGTRIYRLAEPLGAGDTLHLRYRARWEERGFRNDNDLNTDIVRNGTFVNSGYFPRLGYQPDGELTGEEARRKEKLPDRDRMPALGDEAARADTYLGNDADWIGFRATVSTAPDQIAIAPGYLQREYEENGRRVFEYVMDQPILNFYSFLSARYEVRRDRWNDVALEIYYHPGHEYNLDRMMASMKASLAYFSAHFSPYQFRQVRIIEFPRYAQFAQAFPNTVPFSESIGFILRTKSGADEVDVPFYVTAHEVGHQWWAHQVIGANMQGSTLMSEGLANYSALTVLEQEIGPHALRKFLANELDRYLLGRASETKKEMPLLLVENQPYVHYNKGSLVLYAFRDLVGEAAMDRALSAYLRDKAFQLPPYTTSREFLEYLEAVTPDSLRYVIDDFFRTITLWDFQTTAAEAQRQEDGRYRVRLTVSSKKFRADSVGNQEEVELGDLVDVGVFAEPGPGSSLGEPLYLTKHWITAADTTFEVVIDRAPARAGLDPYNKLIDRDPKNNVRAVSVH